MLTMLSLALAQAHTAHNWSQSKQAGLCIHQVITCVVSQEVTTTRCHSRQQLHSSPLNPMGSTQQNHGSNFESIEMILMLYAGIQKSYNFITV